jgi:hypothetical protein
MSGKALLVLENPWWTPDINKRRASVLPFLNGMANYLEHFSVYHSNFYEREGFKTALRDDLSFTREDRLYIYIAAHGIARTIGGTSDGSQGIKLSTVLSEIGDLAKRKNIEGVLIGSCEIGGNVEELKDALKGTRIAWIFGYTCTIDWLGSTMVDLAIFEQTLRIRESVLGNRMKLINIFFKALRKFDGDYPIGCEEDKGTRLKDAITLVTRPRGRGNVPTDDTEALKRKLGWE